MPVIRRPRSLFGRVATILALALLVFTLLAVAVGGWFVVFPVGKRSADDFAALMLLAAKTHVELPPEAEADFRQELLQQHGLLLGDRQHSLPVDPSPHPYLRFLQAALDRRTGHAVGVMFSDDGTVWMDIPVPTGKVRVGFSRERVGARPILMFALILLTGIALTLVASVLLARLVVRPLETVCQAVGEVGGGRMPPALPETGPREITVLARAINRMSGQVRELLENRTVLLSGISHDLRTPLTRLRLALAMLEDGSDPELIAAMGRDLEAMDELIGQFLELAHGLQKWGQFSHCSIDRRKGRSSEGGGRSNIAALCCDVRPAPVFSCPSSKQCNNARTDPLSPYHTCLHCPAIPFS